LCVEAAQINQLVCIGPVWILVNGNGANLELVDEFCYLGDMLSVDDAAAVEVECVRDGINLDGLCSPSHWV